MENLSQRNRPQVIDILTERLEFERSSVRLYDAVISKVEASREPSVFKMLDELRHIRGEEKEHEEWLEAQIRGLGGDAHGETDLSRLIKEESQGIEQVVMRESQIPHLFHALLAAELVDHAGWDLLVELADEAGDHTAKRAFKKRLHEEEEHVEFVKKAVEVFSLRRVLGEREAFPTHP